MAFVGRFKGVITLGIVFGILIFLAVRYAYPLLAGKSVTRIGVTGRYRIENLPPFITTLVGEGLTSVNEAGDVVPSLAASWESPDKGKTWVFKLKDGLTWQDGTPLNANNVRYEFTDVTIEKTDEKTIVFKLENPFSPFPSVVSRPTFKKGLLGTGVWSVKQISVNNNFLDRILLTSKSKGFKLYRFFPTEERTKLALKLGEVDRLEDLIDPTPFLNWPTLTVSENSKKDRYVAVFFNVEDAFLSEKSVRQALSYAVNKEKLGFARAIGPIASDSWAFNPQVKPYNHDKERAKELIAELPKEQKENLNIKLVTTPSLLSVAEKISQDWGDIGFKTQIQVASSVPSDYQSLLAIHDIPKDPDQYALWHSTQDATNITNYKNPRIDKLLEDGRIELSQEKRRQIYMDFQRFLLEDAPAAFLFYPTTYTVSRK